MRTAAKALGLLLTLFSLVLAGAAFSPWTSEASQAAQPGYVVLGDSVDFGVGSSTGAGYVVAFHAFLEGVFGTTVDLHNFAVPGATTSDIFLSQLAPALGEVANHRAFGIVASWGGGGNDLLDFIASPQAATCLQVPSCLARINALLNELEQTVDRTIGALRIIAGPEATILVRTQYNPLRRTAPPCSPDPALATLADAALEGAPGTILDRGLNDRLRTVAARHGAKVVEIFIPFFVFPDALISGDCIHPNDAGYAVILGAFVAAFEDP